MAVIHHLFVEPNVIIGTIATSSSSRPPIKCLKIKRPQTSSRLGRQDGWDYWNHDSSGPNQEGQKKGEKCNSLKEIICSINLLLFHTMYMYVSN